MRVLVDTGVFSASLSRRRRPRFEAQISLRAGQQIFLAAVTVSELRYGAFVAGWGEARSNRLDESIQATTVVPVSDRFLSTLAELRFACRRAGLSTVIGFAPLAASGFPLGRSGWFPRDGH